MPPLAERKEDIPLLVRHFIDHYNRLQKRDIKGIASDALNLLLTYDFPGNIRELQNIIERAFILCAGPHITVADLPESSRADLPYRLSAMTARLPAWRKKASRSPAPPQRQCGSGRRGARDS